MVPSWLPDNGACQLLPCLQFLATMEKSLGMETAAYYMSTPTNMRNSHSSKQDRCDHRLKLLCVGILWQWFHAPYVAQQRVFTYSSEGPEDPDYGMRWFRDHHLACLGFFPCRTHSVIVSWLFEWLFLRPCKHSVWAMLRRHYSSQAKAF